MPSRWPGSTQQQPERRKRKNQDNIQYTLGITKHRGSSSLAPPRDVCTCLYKIARKKKKKKKQVEYSSISHDQMDGIRPRRKQGTDKIGENITCIYTTEKERERERERSLEVVAKVDLTQRAAIILDTSRSGLLPSPPSPPLVHYNVVAVAQQDIVSLSLSNLYIVYNRLNVRNWDPRHRGFVDESTG